MASVHDVPSDIVFEILTRTSLQALGSCRTVSKGWNHLTYDSHFNRLRSERTKTVSGYFIQTLSSNEYSSVFVSNDDHDTSKISLSSLPVPTKIEASCRQGLLFCISQNPQSSHNSNVHLYYVCKPSTKQWQAIPNPKTRYETCSAGIIVLKLKPLQYKIVRLSKTKYQKTRPELFYNLRCEVFDSRTWVWKVVEEVNLHNLELLRNHPAVLANGELHWFTDKDRIISFNADDESLRVSSIPEQLHGNKNYSPKCLVEYKERLALICSDSENNMMEIWRDENHCWSKQKAVNFGGQTGIPEAFNNADVVIMRDSYKLVYYNFKNSSYSAVELKEHSRDIFEYGSDLEPTNLMDR